MSPIVLSAGQGRPTLADVLPNCLAAMRGDANALGLPPARGAVVLLVDGLGALNLRSRAGHARRIVEGWGRKDTALSFPSTTASAITSLTTGARAGEHGVVGYSVYDREHGVERSQISGWGPGMDPAAWQAVPTVFERCGELCEGAEAIAVGMPQYAESGLSRASLRGAEYVSAASIEDRVRAMARATTSRERPLVYGYVAELDQAGHALGWKSGAWLAALEELDRCVGILRDELPRDVGLVITADHGMLDIEERRHIEVPMAGPLLEGVLAVSGEPRFRHLYLGPGFEDRAGELAARWRESEGSRALVATRQEAIDAGWFGPLVTEAARARIGDVLVAAQKEVVYFTDEQTGGARALIGHHGSIAVEETTVPLIRHGAFAR